MAKYAKGKAYKKLESAMLDNLAARGLVEEAYIDKVREYMDLWQQRQTLKDDIVERGITLEDKKRGMLVENRSVSLEVQISRQMLAIFTALGFKDEASKSVIREGGESDEL